MKERRFIELLNLYLDNEIAPAEAAELEAEIYRDAGRRRLYQQYCRMHRACTMLNGRFLAEAPVPAGLPGAGEDDRVVAFGRPAGQTWRRGLYSTAGLAAAACVAFVVLRDPRQETAGSELAREATSAGTSLAATTPVRPAEARNFSDFPTVMFVRAPENRAAAAALPAFASNPDDLLAWTRDVAPLAPEVSTPRSFHLLHSQAEPAVYHGPAGGGFAPAAEMISFQFVR